MRSAKALGLMLHMHRGTPYIYQGEELGMTDAHFTRLDQYRDLESLNAYRQRVEEAKVQSPESMLAGIAARGRDNSRTPSNGTALSMPVSLRRMPLRSHGSPSIPTMRRSTRPANSTIRIRYMPSTSSSSRCATTCLSWPAGDWHLLDADDAHVYAFTRTLGDEKLLVVVNMSGRTVDLPRETAELAAAGITESNVVISTYDAPHAVASLANRELDPWEAAVIQL